MGLLFPLVIAPAVPFVAESPTIKGVIPAPPWRIIIVPPLTSPGLPAVEMLALMPFLSVNEVSDRKNPPI